MEEFHETGLMIADPYLGALFQDMTHSFSVIWQMTRPKIWSLLPSIFGQVLPSGYLLHSHGIDGPFIDSLPN